MNPNGPQAPQAAKPDDAPTDGVPAASKRDRKRYQWGAPEANYATYEEAKDALGAKNFSADRTSGATAATRKHIFTCNVHDQCSKGDGAQMRISPVFDGEVSPPRACQ